MTQGRGLCRSMIPKSSHCLLPLKINVKTRPGRARTRSTDLIELSQHLMRLDELQRLCFHSSYAGFKIHESVVDRGPERSSRGHDCRMRPWIIVMLIIIDLFRQ